MVRVKGERVRIVEMGCEVIIINLVVFYFHC